MNELSCNEFDPQLGFSVHNYLQSLGMETPMRIEQVLSPNGEKQIQLEKHFTHILNILGFDLDDDSLEGTPARLAKMYLELLAGMDYRRFPRCTAVENKMRYDEMIVENNINVMSLCEHHLVVIDGFATVAYIPNEKVIGLSKIPRIVQYFSKRGQIQERLTQQILYALKYILDTEDVAVAIKAKHYCVAFRGVKDNSAYTTTSALSGLFMKPEVRAEFLSFIRTPCGQ